ncbi:MAG: ribosome maturation factor RimP [Fusobacteriaceae bacterium]
MSDFQKVDYAQKVEAIVLPFVEEMGLELVDVEYSQEGGYWYLRVFIEKEDGHISVEHCATLSHKIDEEVDKVIPDKFFLEISSPGIERPLKKIADFIRFKGETVKVALKHKLNDSKNFTGELVDVIDETIHLNIGVKDEDEILEIPLKEIRKANIVYNFEDLD